MPKKDRSFGDFVSVILRVDVDNPYQPSSTMGLVLNRLRIDLEDLFPALPRLGYLSALGALFHDLTSRGLRGSFFFMRSTVPTPELAEGMARSGHAFGFHAHRTDSRSFRRDLAAVRRHLPQAPILGYSKHGSGKLTLGLRHTPGYDEDQLLSLASEMGLRYFSGNGEDPSLPRTKSQSVLFFPSAFWLNPKRRKSVYNIEWLRMESEVRDVVCLLHPNEYAMDQETRAVYEEMVQEIDEFSTFNDQLPQPSSPGTS